MSRADVELPWYWGTGSKTWAGDAGIRSPLGGQLSALRDGVHGDYVVDANSATEGMLRRLESARTAKRIEWKLAQLMPMQAAALKLHFGEHNSLPYAIDAAAALLRASRRLAGQDEMEPVPLATLRKALRGATVTARDEIARLADDLVAAAVQAYNGLPEPKSGREPDIFDPRGRDRHP